MQKTKPSQLWEEEEMKRTIKTQTKNKAQIGESSELASLLLSVSNN